MKLPTLDTQASLAPRLEELLADRQVSEPEPLTRRNHIAEAGVGGALLLVSGLIAAQTGAHDVDIGVTVVLVLMYAVACNVRFHVGVGYTVPTQLVLVPMLFQLPPGLVPLAVAAG